MTLAYLALWRHRISARRRMLVGGWSDGIWHERDGIRMREVVFVLAHLLVARIQDQIRIVFDQPALREPDQTLVESLVDSADGRGREAVPAQLPGNRLHPPHRHALHVHSTNADTNAFSLRCNRSSNVAQRIPLATPPAATSLTMSNSSTIPGAAIRRSGRSARWSLNGGTRAWRSVRRSGGIPVAAGAMRP